MGGDARHNDDFQKRKIIWIFLAAFVSGVGTGYLFFNASIERLVKQLNASTAILFNPSSASLVIDTQEIFHPRELLPCDRGKEGEQGQCKYTIIVSWKEGAPPVITVKNTKTGELIDMSKTPTTILLKTEILDNQTTMICKWEGGRKVCTQNRISH